MNKRILSVLAAIGLAAFPLTACNTTDTEGYSDTDISSEADIVTKNDAADISVANDDVNTDNVVLVDSGYYVYSKRGNVYVLYGATINNPNTSASASFPTITITAKNADGGIIATKDQVLHSMAADDTVSYGGQLDCNGIEPDTVEFSCYCDEFLPTNSTDVMHSSNLIISNVSELNGTNRLSFTGEIENTGDIDASTVAVTLILKDNGKIVYGNTTFVNNLLSEQKKAFEISTSNFPSYSDYEISAQLW